VVLLAGCRSKETKPSADATSPDASVCAGTIALGRCLVTLASNQV
jgi:hypothetical protein